MCAQILGIEPATEEEKPKRRTSQADKWAMHYAASAQHFAREGHLTVPRKHVETITVGGEGEGQAQRGVELKLGMWVDNQRRRAATLAPERMELLSKVGMR
ncbi:helicase associated domain-containing protein [Streptomyces sp. H27-H1]|uniref:helicase associated domain-containing protein n=1 Tax=Streptomyces sp. H27-H1 TaxID=2996461 RepID=UPI003B6321C9